MSDEEKEDSELICLCHFVPKGRLLELIRSGVTQFEDLQKETHCSTGCGGCEAEVRELLKRELEKK